MDKKEENNTTPVFIVSKASVKGVWPKNSLVTFGDKEIYLHIDKDQPKIEILRNIQAAARKLDEMNVDNLKLSNSEYYQWNSEELFAFMQGLYSIKSERKVSFPQEFDKDIKLNRLLDIIDWTRRVINMPGCNLTPKSYELELGELLVLDSSKKISLKSYSGEELADKACVGLITVGNGSSEEPVLYELDYNPSGKSEEPVHIALVGKGITFDTGGYSLKPSEYMKSMHSDMGGSATVAAALVLAACNNYPKRIKAYLCCAENVISDKAMKIGDVINYPNNISVEIANTDAEGRLVLADGLIIASQEAKYIVDAATLTGAAKVALGRDYNAVLSFNRELSSKFIEASNDTYEYAWELPLAKFHQDLVASRYADITNSASGDAIPGATCAAVFLSKFVKNTDNWLHIDLSASYQKSANSCYSVGAKGHGVRSLVQYLEKLL